MLRPVWRPRVERNVTNPAINGRLGNEDSPGKWISLRAELRGGTALTDCRFPTFPALTTYHPPLNARALGIQVVEMAFPSGLGGFAQAPPLELVQYFLG